MDLSYIINKNCILCEGGTFPLVDLGCQVVASKFFKPNEKREPKIPLQLTKCSGECELLQLNAIIKPDLVYTDNYGYRSGINDTMKNHLKNLIIEAVSKVPLKNDDIVIDIGSNDGTLLSFYNYNLTRIGIDPTANYFIKHYQPGIEVISEMFETTIIKDSWIGNVKIITSIAMFYDVPNPIQFVKNIKKILHPQGIWITEQSYCPSMISNNSFDTVCHEHLGYYSIKQMHYIAQITDMKIIDVTMNDINGGSFRITFSHKDSSLIISDRVERYTNYEKLSYLDSINLKFQNAKSDIINFFNSKKSEGCSIYGYGASTKGNTILQYCDLTVDHIVAIADRNPDKVGLVMSTGIPIISEQEMRKNKPDYLFVLPWHFREEFLKREFQYLDEGGKIVFPFPRLTIVERKKAIITGVDGQIGSYLADFLIRKDYIVHGITNKKPLNRNRVKYNVCDIRDETTLKDIIKTVRPNEFYNLAAISNADTDKDGLMYEVNAIPLRYICHLCHKYKIKLFQAGSIEMFRGSKKIESSLDNYHARNSYGKSKITADIMTKYYRDSKGLFVCNGILSNTESPRRKEGFLFSKLKKDVIEYRDLHKVLLLGNLSYQKSWIHAADVASAAYMMLQQKEPSDYVICNNEMNTVKDVVDMFIYKLFKQQLIWKDNDAYFDHKKLVVKAGVIPCRCYEKDEQLIFDNTKLLNIGWQPTYNLEQIVEEILLNDA